MRCPYCGTENSVQVCVRCERSRAVRNASPYTTDPRAASMPYGNRNGPMSRKSANVFAASLPATATIALLRRTRYLTGHSSSMPPPDPSAPGRGAPQAGSTHAGAAYPSKEGGPSHPHPAQEQRHASGAFDASAYSSGPLPPNPAYEEFQREYAARYAPYSEPVVSRRRKGFRAIHMALIFTLGAAAGLTGAWWADSSDQQSAAYSPVPGIASAKPDLPPYEQLIRRDGSLGASGSSGTQGVRGIRPGELPYDGKPPAEDEEVIASAPATSLSSAGISSGAGGEEDDAAAGQSNQPSAAAPAPEKAKTPPVAAVTPAAPSATAGRAAGSGAADVQVKEANTRASGPSAPAKRTAVAKNAKDQEIERIRRQADDELKKKSSAPRRANEERPATRVAQKNQGGGQSSNAPSSSNNHKVMLAQCEAAPNIFRREQCKWKLCNGMWGKNGCPSYAKPNNFYKY